MIALQVTQLPVLPHASAGEPKRCQKIMTLPATTTALIFYPITELTILLVHTTF
jgi:hypothetical protein